MIVSCLSSPARRAVFNRDFLDSFQIEDIAKLLMKRGGVLSWEQGLGKTIAAMLYAKAAGIANALFVVPQDLVPQWQRAAEEKFLADLRPIAGVREAIRLRRRMRGGGLTGWYVTWYEALSQAGKIEEMGAVEWQKDSDPKGRVERRR